MPVIVAKGLHKAYAGFSPVLRGVDIDVEKGELVAIMGPSGCGKSTMLHILGMLHAPDRGSLTIMGTDVLALSREEVAGFRRGNMGFVMQSNNLFEHSTVFENVEFPLIYERVKPQERWERVIRALDLVRLSSRVHYRSNRLSGGEQQRVAIARAMVNAPRILLADEPTGALDARTSRMIMEIFRNLCHSSGVAMVMVTHDPKMAEYCDSVYTLEEGVLVTKKHDLQVFSDSSSEDLLKPPTPTMRGAYVAVQMPVPYGAPRVAEARLLYEKGLLARIYTLQGAGFLANPEGYALPLAIRRLGGWGFFCMNIFRFFSPTFWKFVRTLPSKSFRAQARAIFSGMVFAKWIREEKIAFIFAADGQQAATSAYVASQITGIPFGFDARFFEDTLGARDLVQKSSKASVIRVGTKAVARRLKELVPTLTQNVTVQMRDPLTLEPPEESERGSIDTSDHVLTVVAAGRIVSHKGFDLLLEACALLKNEMQIIVKIAGDGPELGRLKRMAAHLGGLNMVSFLGQLSPEHMESLYAGADIFVSLQRVAVNAFCDEFPACLSEAMAFGLPIIVTDLPVIRDIVEDSRNGLVIPQDDVEALVQAIKRLGHDPDFARTLGLQAQQDIVRLTSDPVQQKAFTNALVNAARRAQTEAEMSD
ncbi:MAG: ATP-binding cassette domain-containing protein [Desulfovibrionaceae bacterium]|nr:ATP-binding cassette domain-containing protein [Desulfovibrionaceae bacterium]